MRTFLWSVSSGLLVAGLLVACGGSHPAPTKATPPTPSGAQADAGGSAVGATKPDERPFAKDVVDATNLIDAAIESKRDAITKCVQEARVRRDKPGAKIAFDIGIDQEGTLIGIKTPKGAREDSALNDCVREALRHAPFPKSTAGVITVRKSFSDELVYPSKQ